LAASSSWVNPAASLALRSSDPSTGRENYFLTSPESVMYSVRLISLTFGPAEVVARERLQSKGRGGVGCVSVGTKGTGDKRGGRG
jgi:hypothetical protein